MPKQQTNSKNDGISFWTTKKPPSGKVDSKKLAKRKLVKFSRNLEILAKMLFGDRLFTRDKILIQRIKNLPFSIERIKIVNIPEFINILKK